MAGSLDFTLNLGAAGFLSGIKKAGAELKGFVGHVGKLTGIGTAIAGAMAGFEGMANVVEGVKAQIEKGAGLDDLSKVTGQSVGDLFRLEKAFTAVGSQAGSVGGMVSYFQKALGGVNSDGESTAGIFGQLGLSIGDLKKMSAPEAFTAISESIGQLDNASASFAASKIFGRNGGAEFLKIARSTGEFSDALQKSAGSAALIERNAAAFDQIEKGLARAKNLLGDFYLGIASGLAPAINSVLTALNKIDLSGLGQQIGTIISAFTQAFAEGNLAEVIGDSISVGFEAGFAVLPGLIQKLGVMLLSAFQTPLLFLQTGMDWVIQNIAKWASKLIEKIPGMKGKLIDFTSADTSWATIAKERKSAGLEFSDFAGGSMSIGDLNASANASLASGTEKAKAAMTSWMGRMQKIAARLTQTGGESKTTGAVQLGGSYAPERTAIEKMGFVFGGGMGNDYGRDTAKNTAQTVKVLKDILGSLGGNPQPPAQGNSYQ